MNHPLQDDFIDIHNHGSSPRRGVFSVEVLMAHEKRKPDNTQGLTYTSGIHPWYLNRSTFREELGQVRLDSSHSNILAIGESGFDRIKGAEFELQEISFTEHVRISEQSGKPIFIHCVKSWEELFAVHRKMRPVLPWIIHGFRGKKELARQLIARGMYISFWFDFIIRPEATSLVKSIPAERIFLETDGSGADIGEIYSKVAADMGLDTASLKQQIFNNYTDLFG